MANPIFDVQVKRTHKFTFQVQAVDVATAAQMAKDMVKNGTPGPFEYDVKYTVAALIVDPDTLPAIP